MSNIFKALIVDDERHARDGLRALLAEYKIINIVGEAGDVDSAIEAVPRLKPDIIFLDIQMPRRTGFDLIDYVDKSIKIVFVTAYDQFAIRAFEVNALDYLLKPIKKERLQLTINKIFNSDISNPANDLNLEYNDRLFLNFNNSMIFMLISNILFIEADSDYTKIHLIDGHEGIVSKTMNEWEKRLPETHFIRIHRSTIINLNFVLKVEKWFNGKIRVHMKNYDSPLFVSRKRASEMKNKLG